MKKDLDKLIQKVSDKIAAIEARDNITEEMERKLDIYREVEDLLDQASQAMEEI